MSTFATPKPISATSTSPSARSASSPARAPHRRRPAPERRNPMPRTSRPRSGPRRVRERAAPGHGAEAALLFLPDRRLIYRRHHPAAHRSERHGAGPPRTHGEGRLGECRFRTGLERPARPGRPAGREERLVDVTADRARATPRSQPAPRESGSASSRAARWSRTPTATPGSSGRRRPADSGANGNIAVDMAGAGVEAKRPMATSASARSPAARSCSGQPGDLEVGIPEGTAAWPDVPHGLRAGCGNALAAAGAPEPSAESVEVRARTTVGDVVIRRP